MRLYAIFSVDALPCRSHDSYVFLLFLLRGAVLVDMIAKLCRDVLTACPEDPVTLASF